jgi:uncharacterized Zn finger protein (UPF0148 family)
MICHCPYCINDLPESLSNGVIFCPKCSRTIVSDKETELISAFKFIKKSHIKNWQKIKYDLQLDDADIEFLKNCIEENDINNQEFEKLVKKVLCSK